MSAPDTVKLIRWAAKLGADGNSYHGMMTSMFGDYYRVDEVDRIVAEKDARIAELSMLATNMEDSWKGVDRYAAMVEVERDALRAQLADAVDTLKATKLLERQWGVTLAADCLKRLGVTEMASMSKPAYMCRADHIEIWHNDSEHELCPLCLQINRFDTAVAALVEIAKPHFNELEYGPSFETMTARAALKSLGVEWEGK